MDDKLWENEKLGRKEEANYLINYLNKNYIESKKPFVLNINSRWGFGKTYFLKNLRKELEGEDNKHKVIYFDAWASDYTKEPLLAFISEIDKAFSSHYDAVAIKGKSITQSLFKSSLPLFFSILAKHLTGMTIDEFNDYIESEDDCCNTDNETEKLSADNKVHGLMGKVAELALKEHRNIGNNIKTFKTNMTKLIEKLDESKDIELPIYILIDELDRCRPNYAIELLENIKHLFDISGLVFIIATDSKQLSHSINAIYGANFDSEMYLKRFFDREYILAEPPVYNYIEFILDKYKLTSHNDLYSFLDAHVYRDVDLNCKLIELYSIYFKLTLRDIEQCIVNLNAITISWNNENKIHLGYILFLIMLKHKDSELFDLYFNHHHKKDYINEVISKLNESNNQKVEVSFRLENKKCTLQKYIIQYARLENMLYGEYITNNHSGFTSNGRQEKDFIIQDIREGLIHPKQRLDSDIQIFTEFSYYCNYTIQGTRFN